MGKSSGVREFGSSGAELSRFRGLGQAEPGVEPSCKCFGSLQGLEAWRAWEAMVMATAAAVEWRGRASGGLSLGQGRLGVGPSRAESRVEPGIEGPRGFVLGSDLRMSV